MATKKKTTLPIVCVKGKTAMVNKRERGGIIGGGERPSLRSKPSREKKRSQKGERKPTTKGENPKKASAKKSQGEKGEARPIEKLSECRTPDGRFKPGCRQPGANVWQPGQSGNPKGRPKGKMLSELLREHLFDPLVGKDGKPVELADGVPMTRADLMIRKAVERAMEGSFHHFAEILERIDGKVPSKLDAMIRSKTELADLLAKAGNGELPTDSPADDNESQVDGDCNK